MERKYKERLNELQSRLTVLDNNVKDLEEIKKMKEAISPGHLREKEREKEEMIRRIEFLENKLAN